MRIPRLTICFLVILCLSYTPRASRADIIYQLVDSAAGSQNGRSLTGTITFDSAVGTAATAADVKDFSFAVTGAGDNFSYSWTGASDVTISGGAINVLADRIDFTFSSQAALFQLRNVAGGGGGQPSLRWQNAGTFNRYQATNPSFATSWIAAPANGTVTIATAVPEPSALFGIGLVGLSACFRRSRPL
ncbi:MAG: PEP-CTERM sorting domain-containing protein [Planctomycetales bacterium]|nr:PEP-CTERM sorting domain-containing protein [Planctomycetales bacterium]